MVIGKIKPTATLVAQFAAGVEVTAIQHEGKMFLPVIGMGEFETSDDAPEKPIKKVSKKSEPVVEDDSVEEESPTKSKVKSKASAFSKDELMDMDTKELTKILKEEFNIDPSDFDGKNTNKKLRDLILNAQKESPVEKEEEEEDEKPVKKSKKDEKEDEDEDSSGDELSEKVGDILEDFDSGKKNKKKTIAAICSLSENADEDVVSELVEKFEDDGDADIDEIATEIANTFSGSKKKAKAEKPSKKSKEELVDVEELEVGDKVSVFWADENEDWFNGEVSSIKKGKVTISYEDGTKDAIDPEIHTKIKRLS